MYWTPIRPLDPPPLKSDDLFYGTKSYWTPPFKNPGHAPVPSFILKNLRLTRSSNVDPRVTVRHCKLIGSDHRVMHY